MKRPAGSVAPSFMRKRAASCPVSASGVTTPVSSRRAKPAARAEHPPARRGGQGDADWCAGVVGADALEPAARRAVAVDLPGDDVDRQQLAARAVPPRSLARARRGGW